MKLRCTENSIRLRLRKSDIKKLSENKVLSVSVRFPAGNALIYEIKIEDSPKVSAYFNERLVSIIIPPNLASQWINSEQVGISENLELSDVQFLAILIEKDFPCKDRIDEDKSDTFQELVPEEGESC